MPSRDRQEADAQCTFISNKSSERMETSYGNSIAHFAHVVEVAGFSLASESRICYPDGVFRFGSPVSTADKGSILSRAFESVDGSAPNVWVYDREGKAVTSATLWLEDAVKVRGFDVGVDYDGTAVASGYATRADGTTEAVLGIIGWGGLIEPGQS